MGIYLPNMKMPTGERPVHIEIHRDGTVIQWNFGKSDEIIGTAVDVPTPHGRIIDADALLATNYGRFGAIDEMAREVIKDAPTIIEAEE